MSSFERIITHVVPRSIESVSLGETLETDKILLNLFAEFAG